MIISLRRAFSNLKVGVAKETGILVAFSTFSGKVVNISMEDCACSFLYKLTQFHLS